MIAAVSWGGGDFAGGMGVRAAGGTTRGALRVILSAHALSLLCLGVALAVLPGPGLHGAPVLWGLFAGVVAGLSLAAFYIALAQGEMGTAAAVSGLLAAAIPAGIGIGLDGRPGSLRLAGFALAAAAIWLIAAPSAKPTRPTPRRITLLAIVGGVGFGVYFAALRFANPLGVFGPLAMARTGSVATCLLLLALMRGPKAGQPAEPHPWLSRTGWLWAVGVAVLDSGGNLFYIAATRAGRLDIAAVLASLYPASTILLAAALLKERPGRQQLFGMAVALVAVVLVTL